MLEFERVQLRAVAGKKPGRRRRASDEFLFAGPLSFVRRCAS